MSAGRLGDEGGLLSGGIPAGGSGDGEEAGDVVGDDEETHTHDELEDGGGLGEVAEVPEGMDEGEVSVEGESHDDPDGAHETGVGESVDGGIGECVEADVSLRSEEDDGCGEERRGAEKQANVPDGESEEVVVNARLPTRRRKHPQTHHIRSHSHTHQHQRQNPRHRVRKCRVRCPLVHQCWRGRGVVFAHSEAQLQRPVHRRSSPLLRSSLLPSLASSLRQGRSGKAGNDESDTA